MCWISAIIAAGQVAELIQISAENLNRQASALQHRQAQDFVSRVRAA
jgi:hypothetical protein